MWSRRIAWRCFIACTMAVVTHSQVGGPAASGCPGTEVPPSWSPAGQASMTAVPRTSRAPSPPHPRARFRCLPAPSAPTHLPAPPLRSSIATPTAACSRRSCARWRPWSGLGRRRSCWRCRQVWTGDACGRRLAPCIWPGLVPASHCSRCVSLKPSRASGACPMPWCLARCRPGGGLLGAAFNRLRLAARPLRARAKHHGARVREAALVAAATVTTIAALSATVGRCAAGCPCGSVPCRPAACACWRQGLAASAGDGICAQLSQKASICPARGPASSPCSCLPVPAAWKQPGWVQHACPAGHYNDLATAWLSPPGAARVADAAAAAVAGAEGLAVWQAGPRPLLALMSQPQSVLSLMPLLTLPVCSGVLQPPGNHWVHLQCGASAPSSHWAPGRSRLARWVAPSCCPATACGRVPACGARPACLFAARPPPPQLSARVASCMLT